MSGFFAHTAEQSCVDSHCRTKALSARAPAGQALSSDCDCLKHVRNGVTPDQPTLNIGVYNVEQTGVTLSGTRTDTFGCATRLNMRV